MTRRQWMVGLAAIFATTGSADLIACGDKFLVPSRGMRFALTPRVRQQATILIYANASSALPGLINRLSLDRALAKAGYRPTIVAAPEEFLRALGRGRWDLVLVDLADGDLATWSDGSGSPAVLAVAMTTTHSDVDRPYKQYTAILKSPTRSQSFVDAFDVALASRSATLTKAAKNAH